jgi:RNA polymerase sigma-70 factor (ECF subfamily)
MNAQNHDNLKEVFLEYYDQYSDDIYRFCFLKLHDAEQARDITQETFMKCWEYMVGEKDIDNERPFLYRIAKNLIIDYYRKKKSVQIENPTDFEHQDDLHDDPTQRLSDHIDGEFAIQLLEKLSPTIRQIIELRFLHSFSIPEIAEVVKQNPKTVSVYLHRGIKQLRTFIKDYEQ